MTLKTSLVIAASLALASLPATADALRDAARAYVKSSVIQGTMDDMLSPALLEQQIREAAPRMDADLVKEAGEIIREEMSALRPAIEEAMIDAAAKSFTLGELRALSAFIATREGASAMGKMAPYMQSAMSTLGPEVETTRRRIASRVRVLIEDAREER
ncbi:MAG: hypothetical protein AAFV86_20815 [Pseudomonadota bacterium]